MAPRVILYGYDLSPFYQKVVYLLAHYKVDWALVKVPPIPPRPMLSDELGITYRRIPVMFLDGQAYFDTALIARVLDNTFGGKRGHGPSLFAVQPALQASYAASWADSVMFKLAVGHLPKAALTPAFVKDRTEFSGASFDGAAMEKARPLTQSQLHAQLAKLEDQLESKFILATYTPQFIDISSYFTLAWIQGFNTNPSMLHAFPRTQKWFADLNSHLSPLLTKPTQLKPDQAAKIIRAAAREATHHRKPAPSDNDPLVAAGWVQIGAEVLVTPLDTGKVPQAGRLVALDPHTITIHITAPERTHILAHFPRAGYDVRAKPAGPKM